MMRTLRVLWEVAIMGSLGVILSSLVSPYIFDEATQQILVNRFIIGSGLYGFLSYGCWWLIAGLSLWDDNNDQPESLDVFSAVMSFFIIPFIISCYLGIFAVCVFYILYRFVPNRVKESIRILW